MWGDIAYLIAGLVLLLLGGNYLTDGAVAVARRFNVSSLMIGLTVVALGSAMPDIAVCVESALEHKTAIAVGNIVGANIFDLLLVVGLMAVVRPWKPGPMMTDQDLPMLVLSAVCLWIVGDTQIFDGSPENVINRSAGLMLLVIFAVYMRLTIQSAKGMLKSAPPSVGASAARTSDKPEDADKGSGTSGLTLHGGGVAGAHSVKGDKKGLGRKMAVSWLMILGGLIALVIGGDWVVDGASGIALKAGMSQGMVALTVVAIGNSLPDITTSLTATLKGQPGLAFGNIVGACIIDALFAIGVSSAITPLAAGTVGFVDFITLVGSALLVCVFPLLSRTRTFTRWQGVILILLYIAYMAFTIIRG